MSKPLHDELDALLIEWEDNTLDDVGLKRLRTILRDSEEARTFFARMQVLSSAIRVDAAGGVNRPPDIPGVVQTASPPSHQGRLRAAFAVLGVCILVGCIGYFRGASSSNERTLIAPTPKEDTSRGIAIVTRELEAVWETRQLLHVNGTALLPGRIALKSGLAQIEFFCGATVILEGPAELELQSASLAKVHSGRLRAHVPPAARGFALQVDQMMVTDLGTEFGLSVSEEGSNVEVFDGEVVVADKNVRQRNLTTGEAVTRLADGTFEDGTARPEQFVDLATFESRAAGQRSARYKKWKSWSDELRKDPRLIAYYAFEETDVRGRRLLSSRAPINTELDGAIVGAGKTPGRWPGKVALEFKRPADRVRVQIPGEYSSLTFSAWVRIDSLHRQFNSLFLTDNYNLGEPHWQILKNGQLYFSVRPSSRNKPGPRDFKALSQPFWNPSLSGKWLHLATVYNVDQQTITHYLDDEVIGEAKVPGEQIARRVRIGTASIGNWSAPTRPDSSFAIRNINGTIDELALFAAALTADEIKEIYENGKP